VNKDHAPSTQGPLIYLNCAGRLEAAETAVVPNGGKVLEPGHQIGPYGHRAVVLDSEGNRVALHSP
jgi:predicted enzyme related to lactoylglutathione lyase